MRFQLKIAIGSIVLVCLIVSAHSLWKTLVRMQRGGFEHHLIMDVVAFWDSNNLRMPNNWDEFESWSATRTNQTRWKAETLRSLFDLKWSQSLTNFDLTNGVFITALHPDELPIPVNSLNNYLRAFAQASVENRAQKSGRRVVFVNR